MMKLLDAEDDSCRYHGLQVVFYCHTCHTLLCPRCLTKGQLASTSDHMSHVYLDVHEAFDIVKDDLEKIIQKIRDEVNQRRLLKIRLQSRMQALGLELLRQKTVLDRRILSMKNIIRKRRQDFRDQMAQFIEPPVSRIRRQLGDVQVDTSQSQCLLRAAEALQKNVTGGQKISFLRTFSWIKNALNDNTDRGIDDMSDGNDHENVDEELEKLSRMDMSFKRELNLLDHAFIFPQKVPCTPKILKSWCTVGSNSASIVWICDSNINRIKSFVIYFKPVTVEYEDTVSRISLADMDHRALVEVGFHSVCITKFLPKRSQAVLRGLLSRTPYILIIFSVNCFARSLPCVAYLQTLEAAEKSGVIRSDAQKTEARITASKPRILTRFLRTMLLLLLLLYILVSTVLIFRART